MQGGLAGQPRGLAQQRNSAIHCTSSLLMLCSKLLQEAALAAAQYADSLAPAEPGLPEKKKKVRTVAMG